ncbi:hypothetical protein GCM10022392_25830 [Mucilaginibacter panaciglaebae]|uniref:Uncharacterized protein n=2 Tax=Mucilaginibacter panaciglaebae TaxID=502331 RepID=A0ABP7WYM6_9SPHI
MMITLICGVHQYQTGGLFESTYLGNLEPIPHNVWLQVIYNDVLQVGIILSFLFIGFSKERIEDEQLAQLRLDSLQWSVYVNYALLILCIVFFYNWTFLSVMMFNVITPLIFFIVRFRWKIYSLNRSINTGAL